MPKESLSMISRSGSFLFSYVFSCRLCLDVYSTSLTSQVYNPNASKKNRWKGLPNMPTKRAGACAVAVGTKIVAMGGVSTKQVPLDAVEIYNIETNEWSTGDTMKEKLMGISSVVRGRHPLGFNPREFCMEKMHIYLWLIVADGKIYVVGGMSTEGNPRDLFMSYDVTKNKWASLLPMPTARYATFSFLIDDKMYVLGECHYITQQITSG